MFKRALFVLMMAGCVKYPVSEDAKNTGMFGLAGENFSSTNSPCLDGVLVAIDHSCAVPMKIEEGYPYVTISCQEVRPGANPWDKYTVVAITNPAIEEPPQASMLCADLHTRVYIQNQP